MACPRLHGRYVVQRLGGGANRRARSETGGDPPPYPSSFLIELLYTRLRLALRHHHRVESLFFTDRQLRPSYSTVMMAPRELIRRTGDGAHDVRVFGSVAKGRTASAGDVDLLVDLTTDADDFA